MRIMRNFIIGFLIIVAVLFLFRTPISFFILHKLTTGVETTSTSPNGMHRIIVEKSGWLDASSTRYYVQGFLPFFKTEIHPQSFPFQENAKYTEILWHENSDVFTIWKIISIINKDWRLDSTANIPAYIHSFKDPDREFNYLEPYYYRFNLTYPSTPKKQLVQHLITSESDYIGGFLNLAATYGDIKVLQELADAGVSFQQLPASYPKNSLSPLGAALESNNTEVVKFLVSKGSQVNFHDVGFERRFDRINLLLDSGYDINKQDAEGQTLLMYTVRGRTDHLIPLLLKRNADKNIKDHEGNTAFDMASKDDFLKNYHPDLIEMLKSTEAK